MRDYVHVNEICDSLKQAIEKPSNSVESLGHGVGRSVTEITETFKKVNNIDFEVHNGDRRKGDIEVSVLSEVSLYMKELYTLEELLKI